MGRSERQTQRIGDLLDGDAAARRRALERARQDDPSLPDPIEVRVEASHLSGEEAARLRACLERGFFFREAAGARARWAQGWVRKIDFAVASMTAAASAAGAAGLVFWPGAVAPVVLELGLVAVLAGLALMGTREQLRREWVRCRFLGEFGRVAPYLVPLGVGIDAMVEHASGALPAERAPSPALVNALRRHYPVQTSAHVGAASRQYAAWFARFLENQEEHHSGSGKERGRASAVARALTTGAFIGATVVTALSAAGSLDDAALPRAAREGLQFLAIVLPVVGGAALLWGVQREDARMGQRSHSMARRLRSLRANVEAQADDGSRADAIVAAALELAAESHEWSELMRTAV